MRRVRIIVIGAVLGLLAVTAAAALGQAGPLNDLFAIGQGDGEEPERAQIERRAEPPTVATPPPECGPGSHEQPGVDGRVPEGAAKDGLNCNISPVGHEGTEGGFKTFRYVDSQGHECAFYDTTLLFPTNAANPGGGSHGVAVLDMSDPANPKKTDSLEAPPMQSPHESLNLNPRRGLLAAVNGNPSTSPGLVAIYDVSADCRHPVLQSLAPVARWGHESGFSADGKTFYATSTAFQDITAIDVTDPKAPHAIWEGKVTSHGMTLSDDGNRAYIADPGGNMLILDTSQIQARAAEPKTREISRLTWDKASIPQNAIPFTSDGKPYVLEFDEYTQAVFDPNADQDAVGAARIIDISDETKPRMVAHLRLQINQPEDHKAAREAGDPGTSSPAQGYAAHYCNLDSQVDPKVVACSFIASGLRVFDITDVLHPKQIGYFVAPSKPDTQNGYDGSNYAMSQPTIVPERREIWYTDGSSGFNVLRVAERVWPAGAGGPGGAERAARLKLGALFRTARSRRKVRVAITARGTLSNVVVTIADRRGRILGRSKPVRVQRRRKVVVKLRRAIKRGRYVVRATGRTAQGQTVSVKRTDRLR